jgi:hypothetical protein
MKADEDRRKLFNQLVSIQSAYNNAARKIDQDDLVAVVLEKAPEKYKSILTAEQRRNGANLALTDLNSCMHDLYRILQSGKKNRETEDTEVSSDNKKRLARQRNLKAISCLTMAFSDDALLKYVG